MYKMNAITVPPSDIFINDKFNREPLIKILTKITQDLSESFVLCVDAKWGTGKTIFVNLWKAYLEKNNAHPVYFNAWENDFIDDPFIPIVAEINNVANKMDGPNRKIESLTKTGAEIAFKGAVNKILGKVISESSASELIELIATKGAIPFFEEQIKSYSDTKDNISAFRETLKVIVEEIQKETTYPFYIFIDELDRCRPTFTIELLERLKHIFDVDGIVFVLTMDKKQLAHSVKSVYGNEFDSMNYLNRFFSYTYELKNNNLDEFTSQHIYSSERLNSEFIDATTDSTNLEKTIIELGENLELTPRDIQQCIVNAEFAAFFLNKRRSFWGTLTGILATIKHVKPELLSNFKHSGNGIEIINFLDSKSTSKINSIITLEILMFSYMLNAKEKEDWATGYYTDEETLFFIKFELSKRHPTNPKHILSTTIDKLNATYIPR